MIRRPILTLHGEDAYLEVPGLLTIRASFLSEGLFDESAGGDPDEQDLYEIEVTHAGEALLEPITFPRLMPSCEPGWLSECDLEEEDRAGEPAQNRPLEQFALALGWELANADPSNWEIICRAARGWDSWMIEDALTRLPTEWTPEPLPPEED